MEAETSVSIALLFVWCGMVLAISFLEAPLKFRAPGVTLPIGLGIGRIVFRGLNVCEVLFALLVGVLTLLETPETSALFAIVAAILALVVQLLAIRPKLTERSNQVLAGADGPRSHVHLWYIVLEVIKVVALVSAGSLLLAG